MRLRGIFYLAATACSLVGCHQPMATPKPPTFQSTEISVRDWKNAAHDVSSELESLGLVPSQWPKGPTPTAPLRPVFVEMQRTDSIFLREAADELAGDILRRGGIIARAPNYATVVSLDVDVVHWTPGDLFPPSTEAVLKATVTIEGQVVMKFVEPIYVRDGDTALYQLPQHLVLSARLLRYDR